MFSPLPRVSGSEKIVQNTLALSYRGAAVCFGSSHSDGVSVIHLFATTTAAAAAPDES